MPGRLRIPLLLLTLAALSTGEQWLMEGDFISAAEAVRRGVVVESSNSTYSVSSSLRVNLAVGRRINCVIAAALHMNGDVAIVQGGVNSTEVDLTYTSLNREPDQFFVLVEYHVDTEVRIRNDLAENARVAIVLDGLRDWRGEE